MVSKKYAKVEKNRCVACGACVKVCPKSAIQVWRGCNACVNDEICIGCGLCSKICPANCITIEERA